MELGPETELERTQRLLNEVEQERLTSLDRSLLARTRDGFVVVASVDERDPVRQTMRIGRLNKLARLSLNWRRDPCIGRRPPALQLGG